LDPAFEGSIPSSPVQLNSTQLSRMKRGASPPSSFFRACLRACRKRAQRRRAQVLEKNYAN